MSLLKYIDRLKRMDDLIYRKATGNAQEFARKLNMSESQLFQEIKEMKQLGAPVKYCHVRKSYYYEGDYRLKLNFTFITGGQSFEREAAGTLIIQETFILR